MVDEFWDGGEEPYAHTMGDIDPYRRIANVYDRLIEPMQAGVRRVALEVVPPQAEWQVLDVGCGTGTGLARYLACASETR